MGYAFLFFKSSTLNGHTICLFKNITGYPCPSCGSTRATVLLLNGNFMDSVFMNPLAILTNFIIVLSFFWILIDIVQRKDTYWEFMKKSCPVYLKVCLFILLLINWVWNINKGL